LSNPLSCAPLWSITVRKNLTIALGASDNSGEMAQATPHDLGLVDELVGWIEQRRVIPIVGGDLNFVQIKGRNVLLQQYLGEQLVESLSLDPARLPEAFTIDDVVAAYLDTRGPPERIASRLQTLMKTLTIEPPLALRKLARIDGFNLFVTTNFDDLLESALRAERVGSIDSLVYAGNERIDLPSAVDVLSATTVYHLFGKVSAMTNTYAVTEEDTLEFMCALQSDGKRPPRLFDGLREHHLLLVGCNFSDWLARFFIRAVRSVRPSNQTIGLEYVADEHVAEDKNFVIFLKRFSHRTELVRSLTTSDFVDLLFDKWEQRHGKKDGALTNSYSAEPQMPSGAVFISYAREDRAAALRMQAALRSINIGSWLDREQLEGGDYYVEKMMRHIKQCGFFMPLISQHTQTCEPRFFRREWTWALERAPDFDHSDPFILPVSLDGTDSQAKRLPGKFRELQWIAAHGGQPERELLERLRTLLSRATLTNSPLEHE
jgi:hypothetical protein